SHADFSPRCGHRIALFNQRLWLVGGGRDGVYNDVWTSQDGIHWQQVLEHAPFSARLNHELVVFDQRLWVIGGRGADESLNDVWSSVNGTDWIQETTGDRSFLSSIIHRVGRLMGVASGTIFPARANHQAIAFNGLLWVIGGEGPDGIRTRDRYLSHQYDDVWTSNDGRQWHRQPVDKLATYFIQSPNGNGSMDPGQVEVPFSIWELFGSETVITLEATGERLWFIGGHSFFISRVWSTLDGKHWVSTNPSDSDSAFKDKTIEGHQALRFDNQFWVIGKTFWRSSDGWNWQELEPWVVAD
ncbi:kelch repeat-containing protein, partial [Saccharospirillum mangrovi]